MSISIKTAELVLREAVGKAIWIGVPMNVAVLDEGGRLKVFVRMDGALSRWPLVGLIQSVQFGL
jgi:uncharacterized protein GlcG (DUF336 family)